MYPVLLDINGIQIGSYGVCLALAFVISFLLFRKESIRVGLPSEAADYLLFSALLGGMLGGKLLYVFESTLRGDFSFPGSFSPTSGFAALGGFLLAFVLSGLVLRWQKYPAGLVFNIVSPALILAYGIARIGCQLAGDGDYGIPSDLPWAMAYPNGVIPTLLKVHPTPIYELISSLFIFVILWRLRFKLIKPFELFALYLVLSGIARFLVEFIRRNPEALFGLTSSQIIALMGVLVGGALMIRYRSWSANAVTGHKNSVA